MQVDKKNGNICFNDEKHIYWNNENDRRYTSVTTMVEHFKNDFDKEFWSGYKAIEKIIGLQSFRTEKSRMLDSHKIDLDYFKAMYDFDDYTFNSTKQDILDAWSEENKLSCDRGTEIHAQLENQFYKSDTCSVQKYGLGGSFKCKKNYYKLDLEQGVYPEYLLYLEDETEEGCLAGQADLIIKNGQDIYIVDYKTNKKLDQKSFFDQKTKKPLMMKYPLNDLMDCHMSHYTLQLSTYAWMIQKLDPSLNIKDLIIVHYDHSGKETVYHLDYLKDTVDRMYKAFKKEKRIANRKAKRKPIEF